MITLRALPSNRTIDVHESVIVRLKYSPLFSKIFTYAKNPWITYYEYEFNDSDMDEVDRLLNQKPFKVEYSRVIQKDCTAIIYADSLEDAQRKVVKDNTEFSKVEVQNTTVISHSVTGLTNIAG